MLYDKARIAGFRSAINHVVKPGDIVLELGSGTGVLSFYAAEKASKVYSVEYNLELAEESRRLLRLNPNEERIEVIHADAFEYIPPEPVDAVICEMLHVGLLREKQLAMIASFKSRYQLRFKDLPLPKFIPTAVIQAVQPIQHDFRFEGYYAPLIMFQDPYVDDPRTTILGDAVIYHQLLYEQPYDLSCRCSENMCFTAEGTFNAIRIITKNILAIEPKTQAIIDWHNLYLIVPLKQEISVRAGQRMAINFDYPAGAPLSALRPVVTNPQI
jgi:predicted RNA methylase